MNIIWQYRSPYRPMPMNYIPKDVEFIPDYSTIGAWTPNTIYAFSKQLPVHLIEQWSLKSVNER